MNIGELARRTATKAETIRYYERVGVLKTPLRSSANYRAYGPADVTRLSLLRRVRALGFSMNDVRELLELSEHRQDNCERVDDLTRRQLQSVDQKIADLAALRGELARLIHACPGKGSIADCRILEGLQPNLAKAACCAGTQHG